MPSDRASLQALKNIIAEVDLILETTPDLPQNRTGRSRELLGDLATALNASSHLEAIFFEDIFQSLSPEPGVRTVSTGQVAAVTTFHAVAPRSRREKPAD